MNRRLKTFLVIIFGLIIAMILAFLFKYFKPVSHRQAEIQKTRKTIVDSIQIGQSYVYEYKYYFRFVDDRHFVYLRDDARYSTQKELEKASAEEEAKVYPQIEFAVGTVAKKNNNYKLRFSKEVVITFSDVKSIKNKVISSKEFTSFENSDSSEIDLKKTSKGYVITKQKDIIEVSERQLPKSIDDFLSQYQYKPEELN